MVRGPRRAAVTPNGLLGPCPLTGPFCPRDGYPGPVEHLSGLGPSLYRRWMPVVVADRPDFQVQPEDCAELGAVDAGVADESKQFCILLE